MSQKVIMKAGSIVFGAVGLWLCWGMGWKPIVGFLFLMWGNNVMLASDSAGEST